MNILEQKLRLASLTSSNYGRIFVYNICHISRSDTVFEGAATLATILKGHSTINCPKKFEPDVLNTSCATHVQKIKIYKEFMSSLAPLPPGKCSVVESQFLISPRIYTQNAKTFTNY